VVDRTVLAEKTAAVRDAVSRIREVLPPRRQDFLADRSAREIVALNLFVAVQECLSLATHWLADEGLAVPQSYSQVFRELGQQGVVTQALAERLAASAGLRNLLAHRYGALDWERLYEIASSRTGDFSEFCAELSRRAAEA
jgi:uncharacterized protein YutE (UPF0331/DUF86 family)